MLLESAEKNADKLRTIGRQAVADAKRAGVAAYYMDPTVGEGIIKELPDGTRQRVKLGRGEDIVIATLPPA